jgi:hypothetical protein
MKNLFKKALVTLVLIGFLGCLNENIEKPENENTNLSVEVDITEIDVSSLHNPIGLNGYFDYWVSKENQLAVFTKTDSIIHIFMVEGLNSNKIDIGTLKEVIYLDHSMLLNGSRGVVYTGVEIDRERQIFDKLPEHIKSSITQTEYGFALMHYKVPKILLVFTFLNFIINYIFAA